MLHVLNNLWLFDVSRSADVPVDGLCIVCLAMRNACDGSSWFRLFSICVQMYDRLRLKWSIAIVVLLIDRISIVHGKCECESGNAVSLMNGIYAMS